MKKKILAALSALTLGATMMAGTAMSASAITVTNNGGDGKFYFTYNNGVSWMALPHSDSFVASATENTDGSVTLVFQTAAIYNTTTGEYEHGYVSAVYDDGSLISDSLTTIDSYGRANLTATIWPDDGEDEDEIYTMTVVNEGGTHPGGSDVTVKFVIS